MKKTIFLSLVAGAMILTGCGGGGGNGSSGNNGGGNGSSGNNGGGDGSARTYTPFQYPAERLAGTVDITVNADNTWTIANDTRTLDVAGRGVDKNYAAAEQYCSEKGMVLPSANDLLAFANPANITSAWAKGKFTVFFTDNTIGQVANEDAATEQKVVICMTGDSIEKKHDVTVNADDTVTDNNTGLTWSPFKTYDKGLDANNTNQYRFPISNPGTTPAGKQLLTAEEYCKTLGAEWELPTLGELRSIIYLDGTTDVKDPEGLNPTVVWTSTKFNDGRNYVIKLNANGTHAIEDGNEATNPGNASFYVTCVKR